MSDFNLFSKAVQKELEEKKVVRLPRIWVIIIGINLCIFLIALVMTFVNIYYNVQMNDRGKKIIDLMATQRQYSTTSKSVEDIVAKNAAVQKVNDSRIYLENIIAELDKQTNNTTTSQNIDVGSGNYSIKGVIKNKEDIITIVKQLRQSKIFSNVHLNAIQSKNETDSNDYSYTISFILNTDEAKQFK